MTETCKHERFQAQVNVHRLEDSGRFIADIKIFCVDCESPFHFPGVPCGLDFDCPMASADATELRAPIRPGHGPVATHAKFTLPPKIEKWLQDGEHGRDQ